MAQNSARKPRPVNDPVDPTDHARPAETDTGVHPEEASVDATQDAGRGGERTQPEKTYLVNSSGEVRAGPGDAGMQDVPNVLDDPQNKPKRGRGPLLALLLAGPVLLIIIWILTA